MLSQRLTAQTVWASKPKKKCSGDPRAQDLSACAPWSRAWTQTPASACRSLPPCTLSPCSGPVAGPRLAGPHCGLPITFPMWPPVTTAGSSQTRCALGTLWPELSLLEATESMARLEVAGRGTAKIKQSQKPGRSKAGNRRRGPAEVPGAGGDGSRRVHVRVRVCAHAGVQRGVRGLVPLARGRENPEGGSAAPGRAIQEARGRPTCPGAELPPQPGC